MTSQSHLPASAAVREVPSVTAGFGTRQWPLLAAVAFVLLLVVRALIVGAPPDANATGAQVVAYYRDHAAAIRISVWLATLAMLPFVALVAWLLRQVRGIGRDVLLIGAAAYAIEGTVWQWVSAGLALHPGQLDPHTARTLLDVTAYVGPMWTASVILLAAPIGWAAIRNDNDAPAWFVWLTVVLVVEQAVETITILGTSGVIAPDGPMNFPLGAGIFLLWIIACGAVFPAISAANSKQGPDRREETHE